MSENNKDKIAYNSNPLLTHQKFDYKSTVVSILAGGMAGISVDFALFPVDSIKTRL